MFNKCEYVISAVTKKQFPNTNNLNEYVFLGRSNVGKSSLINAITNRKILARTSSKPGKTRALNFFLIDDSFYLVDVPGYGYASTGLNQRLDFGGYLEEYLVDNPNIKAAFLLVDTKVGPTKDDILMFEYLKFLKINIIIVTTKADKIGTTHLHRHLKQITTKLNTTNIIPTSSDTKLNINKIQEMLS
ncbi:MAG: ribosome biogenesis GTP-binding protein YihA/YsxC [Bacilli bacterium]